MTVRYFHNSDHCPDCCPISPMRKQFERSGPLFEAVGLGFKLMGSKLVHITPYTSCFFQKKGFLISLAHY